MKLERRVTIGLLYILNNNKYLEYYKKGFIKYIPEFILPSIKPRIIDNIVIEGNTIGKVVGINLKAFDASYKSNLDVYLMAINEIKVEEDTRLYIEGQDSFNKETLDYIQEFTNIKISNGENIRIKNLPFVIREVYNLLKENIQEKEILIVCDDTEKIKLAIKSISKDIRFISAIGCDKGSNEEIYEYILEETGLSLFYTSNIDRILENYSIIINFIDNVNLDFSKVRKNCIIFDFAEGNSLNNKKIPVFIKDFAFDLKDLGIKETKWLDSIVGSSLLEALLEDKNQNVKYLYLGNDYYPIKDYVNSFIKIKGKF